MAWLLKWRSEENKKKDARKETIDTLWNAEEEIKNSKVWNDGRILRRSNESSFQCEIGNSRCLLGKVNIDFQDLGLKFKDHYDGDDNEFLRKVQDDEFTSIFFDHDQFMAECPQLSQNISEDNVEHRTQPFVSV